MRIPVVSAALRPASPRIPVRHLQGTTIIVKYIGGIRVSIKVRTKGNHMGLIEDLKEVVSRVEAEVEGKGPVDLSALESKAQNALQAINELVEEVANVKNVVNPPAETPGEPEAPAEGESGEQAPAE